MTDWFQTEITLEPKPRGFHLITEEIQQSVPAIAAFTVGIAHIFIQHTSASLAINENWEPEVRSDMKAHFDRMVPEDAPYTHRYEGADDMPAHIKSVLTGSSITVPITGGALNLGTWQGIYLCEHRNRGGGRRLVITVSGKKSE